MKKTASKVKKLLAALCLLAAAGAAGAQSCNPSTPQVDPGTGFVAFGAREQLMARGGQSGPAWEWAIGTDTEVDGQNVKASLDWVSGKSYNWTLAYTGTGSATVELRDGTTLLFTRTFATGMDAGNALQFQVSTNPSIGPTTTIAATVTGLNGHPVAGAISQSGNNQESAQNLYYFFPPMSAGFTAQGTVALTYASLPAGSRVQFQVRAGNIPCTGGNTPPTVALTGPANGTVFTAPATITLTANAADADGTVTQVQFFQGATPIATVTAPPYATTVNNVAAGSYSFTAVATDNGGATTTSAPVTVTVNAPPTVALTSPANGTVFTAPATITLAANAADADGTVAQVQFFDGATPVGTATSAPYSVTLANVAAGAHTYTAIATDNQGATATSAAVSITVNAGPSVNLTSPANGAVFTAPATITLTANATDADGTVAQVEFYQGATLLATVTTPPYTFTLANVAAGAYSFTAKATDNQGASTTSAAVAVIVNAAPTVTITSPANNAVFTAPASITVTATAADADGTIAQVELLQGATVIATLTSAPYTHTLSNVGAGSYTFTARATDNQGAITLSAPVSVTVNPAVAQIYFIHSDHLNTPRLITNNVGQAVWKYDNTDPFGGNVPDENPSGLGVFEFPLRDEGTYSDKETGLVYNWNRYRDLGSGRFIQTDPLGLEGGDLSLYVLRSNNPLSFTDPLGLMGRGGMPTRGGYWPPGRGPQYPSNVWVCARPVDINWLPDGSGNYLPQHAWIKTPNVEAGMGGDCPVPGQQCSDSPYVTNTKVVSHAGQSGQAGAVCRMQTNVDQKCVENLLETGRATGRWTVTNQCQSFVSDVINACRR